MTIIFTPRNSWFGILPALCILICHAAFAESAALFSAQRVAEIAEMLPEQPTGLGPTGAERERWQKLASTKAAQGIVRKAEV
ncbi:MAG: hypothetical protein IKR13_00850, partial [Victivallales bacterium]|nr:hypothetical protein [Victivallales bacterium]